MQLLTIYNNTCAQIPSDHTPLIGANGKKQSVGRRYNYRLGYEMYIYNTSKNENTTCRVVAEPGRFNSSIRSTRRTSSRS